MRLLLLLGHRLLPDQVAYSADVLSLIAGQVGRRVVLAALREEVAAIKVSGRAAAIKAQERLAAATRERVEQQVLGGRAARCIRRVLRRPVVPEARLALGLAMLGRGVADPVSVRRGLVSAHGLAERLALRG